MNRICDEAVFASRMRENVFDLRIRYSTFDFGDYCCSSVIV